LNRAAGQFGDSAIAALSVSLRLFMLLLMALFGLAQGLQPLVGYNYGARNIKRVLQAVRLVFIIVSIIGLCVGIVAFFLASNIMHIFAPQDAYVVSLGVFAIRVLSLVLIPVGCVIMFGGTFQALGKGTPTLILAISQQGGILIPLVILLPRVIGLNGVFLAQPLAFVLSFFIGLGLFIWVYSKVLRPKLLSANS
jgi:Na+-driven multidrug efflux pump